MPALFVLLSMAIPSSTLTVPITPYVEITPQEIWIEALHQCENPENIEKVWDTNNQWSYGYLQFQMGTWLSYGKEFGATRKNIGDDELQKKVAMSMLDKGGWKHWLNCGKVVRQSLGAYPLP